MSTTSGNRGRSSKKMRTMSMVRPSEGSSPSRSPRPGPPPRSLFSVRLSFTYRFFYGPSFRLLLSGTRKVWRCSSVTDGTGICLYGPCTDTPSSVRPDRSSCRSPVALPVTVPSHVVFGYPAEATFRFRKDPTLTWRFSYTRPCRPGPKILQKSFIFCDG